MQELESKMYNFVDEKNRELKMGKKAENKF